MSGQSEFQVGEMLKADYGQREHGWIEVLGGGKYRIANVPISDRLNMNDVVTCTSVNGYLVVDEVLSSEFPNKTLVYYDTREQYRALWEASSASGNKTEGMIAPYVRDGVFNRGLALVNHKDDFDPIKILEDLGVEDPALEERPL